MIFIKNNTILSKIRNKLSYFSSQQKTTFSKPGMQKAGLDFTSGKVSRSNEELAIWSELIAESTSQMTYRFDVLQNQMIWFGETNFFTFLNAKITKPSIYEEFVRFIHEEDKAKVVGEHQKAISSQKGYSLDYRICVGFDDCIIVKESVKCLKNDSGVFLFGIITDISAESKAKQILQVKERTGALIGEMFKMTGNVKGVEELIYNVMKLISVQLHWNFAHAVMLYNVKFNFSNSHNLYYTKDPLKYDRLVSAMKSQSTIQFSQAQLSVIMNKKSLWLKDIDKNKQHNLNELAIESGLQHIVIFPLLIRGQVIGLLEFFTSYNDIATELMPELLDQIGMLLGSVVEQKANEVELNKFSLAIEQNFATVVMTTGEGFIEYVNPMFTRVTGYLPEEVLGKKMSVLKSGVHDEAFYEALWEMIKKGETWFGEICNKKKSGELFWEQVNISPIKDENNDISHYVAVKIDITEKRKAEEELLRAKEAAESANKAKSEFLANMSHEIRTPMNAILGFAELLHSKIVDEQQLSFLDSIKSSGKNLLTIINDVLDLSKVEAGKMVVSKEFVDLFLLLKDIEYMFKLKAVEKGLDFNVEVDFNIPAGIETDEVRLRQILINVIGNAIKFTSNGYVKVKAHSRKISDKLVDITIEVEDTGIGMSKDYQEKLFEPFTQEDSQITKRFGGTGLGLSISKKLIELLNGEMFVESEQEKGSRFTVVFHEVKFTHKEQKELELIQISPDNIKFDSALLLIADDVAANRKYFKSVLQDTNLRIIESENGLETFEKAKINRPEILITDLKMPGCSGFELFKMLREDHSFDNMKIVATTATASIEERDKLQVHNFDGLLIKPIQVNDVFIELMRLLPHEIVYNTEKIEHKNIEEFVNINQNNEKIYKILESELLPIWKTFESQQPIDEVEDFARKIREIGQEHSCESIISYGNLLVRAINNFDIDAMLKNLNDFPKLISTFKKDN